MNQEIERKFLVEEFDPSLASNKIKIVQGYIFKGPGKVTRVRTWDNQAFLTIKYRVSSLKRMEFEYEIPYEDALHLLEFACEGRVLEKIRYQVPWQGKTWEVDVFSGKNQGLILAEIELDNEEESFILPPFIGKEVTGNSRYSNHNLAKSN